MKWYSFHIGDYHRRTAHLTELEDLAYRRMLDLYYTQDGPLPADPARIAKLIRMPSAPEIVRAILAEFFVETDAGWRNDRCEKELHRGASYQQRATRAAARRWAKDASSMPQASDKQCSSNASSIDQACLPIPLPLPLPLPLPEKSTSRAPRSARARADRPEDVGVQVWEEFAALRKARRAPVTDTVVAGIRREAKAAGVTLEQALRTCVERGWQGFRADWIAKNRAANIADIDYGTEQVQDI